MKRQITILAIVLAASFLFGLAGCSNTPETGGSSKTGSDFTDNGEYALMIQSYEKERDRLIEEAAGREDEISRQNNELSQMAAELGDMIDDYKAEVSQLVGENHEFSETASQLNEQITVLLEELGNNPGVAHRFWKEMEYPHKKVLSVGAIGTYSRPGIIFQPYGTTQKNAYLEVLCCVYPGFGIGIPKTLEDCFLLVRFFTGESPSPDIAWVLAADVEPYNAETRSHLKSYVTIKEGAEFWIADDETGEYAPIGDIPGEEAAVLRKGKYNIDKIEGEFAYIFLSDQIYIHDVPPYVKCYAKDLVYPDY